jgi:hypothetical protein
MMNSAGKAIGFAAIIWGASFSQASLAQTVRLETPDNGLVSERKTMVLSKDVAHALRAEAVASDEHERLTAVERLSQLHRELAEHGRFSKSQLLQQQRRRIEIRLLHIYEDLAKKNRDRAARESTKPEIAVEVAEIDVADNSLHTGQVVGQVAGRAAGGGGAGSTNRGDDYSVQLIEIISSTITPDTWETVGGPGSIRYYRQGMALVVRAPQAVHDKMVDLLTQLRAAGP